MCRCVGECGCMNMAETASALAKSGAVTDRKLSDDLIRTAGKVCVCVCVGM